MIIPNFIGMDINHSINKLLAIPKVHEIIIKKTDSPITKTNINCSEYRVVRQKIYDNSIELIVSCF